MVAREIRLSLIGARTGRPDEEGFYVLQIFVLFYYKEAESVPSTAEMVFRMAGDPSPQAPGESDVEN